MKVLGVTTISYSDPEYICSISHAELKTFLGTYFKKEDPFNHLKVGQEVDLGAAYNFMRATQDALKKTEEFVAANKRVIDAVFNGITVMQAAAEQSTKEESYPVAL